MDAVQGVLSLVGGVGDVLSRVVGAVRAPADLENALHQLETMQLPSARLLINRSEWGMFKDTELDKLIWQLKYATYDAEDLLRGFKDQALRQKIEGAGRTRAGQLYSSSRSNVAHIFPGSTGRGVKEAQDKLEKARAEVENELNRRGLHVVPVKFMPTTTEIITAPQVFGRETERDQVMEVLGVSATIGRIEEFDQVITQMGMPLTMGSTSAGSSKGKSARHQKKRKSAVASTRKAAKRLGNNSSSPRFVETTNLAGNVSVLPIFGIGGIGKTTLAQLIYNDERVRAHFTVRIWVCVSDLFDDERMTKEIVKTISEPNIDLPCDIGDLQVQLKEQLKSQKFLLVLDDIWPISQQQWEYFYAPLRRGLEGSMILVTTRHQNIAHLVTTSNCEPVQLKGLPDDIFWEFFKECAFDKNCPESYPHLQEIGRRICFKLRGTPLAAKTLGRLLNSKLSEDHWSYIEGSELWEQPQKEGDILPALRLSYLYLPIELRRCFAFCSMFPKDYSFERREIVDIWVAEGFVAPKGRMRLEDMGDMYLDELRGRCLFQTDPKFPDQDRYVMHDLIHDTAQQASMHECLLMTDLRNEVIHEWRHISVEVDGESLSTLEKILHLNKLRSLRFGTKLKVEMTWFSMLSNILFLSLRDCKLDTLPERICELSSLRYLDISHSHIKELPAKFWCLYSLQVVDASRSRLGTIHQDVTKLTKLRQLALPPKASLALSRIPGLGNLSCLRNLSYFTVIKKNGVFQELNGMNQLRGTLCIRSISSVNSMKEAAEARLVDKKYLKELDLHWREHSGSRNPRPCENEVFDGMCPHETIQHLKVHCFFGDRLPNWLNPKDLQNLRSLEFSYCHCLETLSNPYFTGVTQVGSTGQHASSSINCSNGIAFVAFTRLTSVRLFRCDGLKNLDQFLSPKNLPSLESISLDVCCGLESIPAEKFVGFVRLRDLKIKSCPRLVCSRPSEEIMVLPPSLRRLCIWRCGELDRSFPSCLQSLTSLTVLCLIECDNVESIPCINTLRYLALEGCKELSSIGGSGVPSSEVYNHVFGCPKLSNYACFGMRARNEEEKEIGEWAGTSLFLSR